MKTVKLYQNKAHAKTIYIIKLLVGLVLLFVLICLFLDGLYLDAWTFIAPLIGLSLVISGLSDSMIKEVSMNSSDHSLHIQRDSLFRTRIRSVDLFCLSVELKTTNGKKNGLIPKIKLVILESGKEVDELKSGFMSLNNSQIESLYKDLKSVVKIAEGESDFL
jgi:hypothetical protein